MFPTKCFQRDGSFIFLNYVQQSNLFQVKNMLEANSLLVHDYNEVTKQANSLHWPPPQMPGIHRNIQEILFYQPAFCVLTIFLKNLIGRYLCTRQKVCSRTLTPAFSHYLRSTKLACTSHAKVQTSEWPKSYSKREPMSTAW